MRITYLAEGGFILNLQLTPNERQIMDLIWDSDHPLSRNEILTKTQNRTWNPSSIHLILNSMLSKGVLQIANKNVKYARTYEAAISREEYMLQIVSSVTSGNTFRDRLFQVVTALVNQKTVDEETIEELEKILEDKRKKLKDR